MKGNITAILQEVGEIYPHRAAFLHGSKEMSFSELAEAVGRMAARLRHEGIVSGDNVLILAPISIELYIALLGTLHLGAVAVVVDIWGGRRRIDEACRTIPIRGFISTRKGELLRLLSPTVRKIKSFIDCSDRNEAFAPIGVVEREPDAPALITFTTGSTGTPKGAVRSHRFLLKQHDTLVRSLALKPHEVSMPTLPIVVLSNLALATTTVIPRIDFANTEAMQADRVVEDLLRTETTTMIGSPAFFERLASEIIASGKRIASLREVYIGGAAVFPSLAQLLTEAFPDVRITIVYGSTEAEPISRIDAHELLLEKFEDGLSVGRPIEEISLRIIECVDGEIGNDSGKELIENSLPIGSTGEICVSGEHVLARYYHNEEGFRRSKIVVDGIVWHRTGDAGWVDRSGGLHLMGRVGERFTVDGVTYFPFPIEQRLLTEPEVRRGTVVALGTERILVIEPQPGRTIDEETRRRIATACPVRLDRTVVMQSIPTDPRHRSKIDYDALRRRLSNPGSLAKRFFLYQRERFPFAAHTPLIVAFTFSAASYSRICRGADGFIPFGEFAIGAITSLLFFFLLRVFDEFKDAGDDARYRPYRPVPRGLISLRELGFLGGAAVALQIILNALVLPWMLPAWGLVIGFMLLMRAEFFVGSWLKRHPLAYMASHMIVMPLIDFYTTGLDWITAGIAPPSGLEFFLGVTFLNGIVVEVGRKIRGADAEEVGVETYSALYGAKRATIGWLGTLGLTCASAIVAASHAGFSGVGTPVLLLLAITASIPAFRFLRTGEHRHAQQIELAAGGWTIAMYLLLGGIPMMLEFLGL